MNEYQRQGKNEHDDAGGSDVVRRQGKILENLHFDTEGGVLAALERRRHAFAEVVYNSNASREARDAAARNWNAADELYSILSDEIVRRDPAYFSQNEMQATLESEVKVSEKRVEQSMVDGYIGEDGFIHKAPNGEKIPSEDAKIDLNNAKQDVETFHLLMKNFHAVNNYATPRAIKKEDFAPTIDKFIDEHTRQIDQLLVESRALAKGTAEYAENEAKRKQLVKERKSAKRLNDRFFNVPRAEVPSTTSSPEAPAPEPNSDVSEANTGQISTNEAEEQVQADTKEAQQEQSSKSYDIDGGMLNPDVTLTVGQKIPDDWFEPRSNKGGSTSNGFGITINRAPLINDYLTQAFNIEFSKLSKEEQQRYNYPALAKTILAEAKRTRMVPNISDIINKQRVINEQRENVEHSY